MVSRGIYENVDLHYSVADIHEFLIVDEKTALIEAYHPLTRDLSDFGGDNDQIWIVEARLQGELGVQRLRRIPV